MNEIYVMKICARLGTKCRFRWGTSGSLYDGENVCWKINV